jgi:hypothetical protein
MIRNCLAAVYSDLHPRQCRSRRAGILSARLGVWPLWTVAPDYITPSVDQPGYLIGDSRSARPTRAGTMIFAAASVDDYCQQDGSPRITILEAPRGARISTDIGSFVAVQNDGGSKRCIGKRVRGTRLYYRGRGDRVVLRVAYPTKGLTYDHVIGVR